MGPKLNRTGHKVGPKWDPNGTQMEPKWDPSGTQSGTQAGPKWDPNGFFLSKYHHFVVSGVSSQSGTEVGPKWGPKRDPNGTQIDRLRDPSGTQMGPKIFWNKFNVLNLIWGDCWGTVWGSCWGTLWVHFGSHFGPTLGPTWVPLWTHLSRCKMHMESKRLGYGNKHLKIKQINPKICWAKPCLGIREHLS